MKKYFLFVFIVSFFYSNSQEVLSDLISNPILSNKEFFSCSKKNVVSLPFIDDFSYDFTSVDPELWQQSSVFVNRNYPINPPTLGVATFDGMNEKGLARDFSPPSSSEPSDTLLSQVIDLSGQTSVYLMFYFQGKGIGDTPQIQDKLILEFLKDSVWVQKFVVNGQAMQEFKKEVIIIDSAHYLTNNFQFRFRNYATVSGNFDHWHIDYVKLDAFLSPVDTSELNDVAFVYNSPSFLKRYSEMPWTHFINNEAYELKDSINIILRNNDASVNVDYQYNIFEDNNQIFHYPTIGVSRNESVLDYDIIGNYSFSDPPIDVQSNAFYSFQPQNTTFVVQNIIGTALSDNKLNDTLYHIQNFHSHFSYDDGIAESAYGINVNGGKIAYEFKLNRPDTLRAIKMYFPQMLDSVNNLIFKLTVWDNISASENIVYQKYVSPVHTENGDYYTYYLDSVIQLVGTFYVGWEQTTNDLLNIGLDKNNEANNYMYYNVGAGWTMSSYPGSWMIRPVLSMQEIISSEVNYSSHLKMYPNPVISDLFIETSYSLNNVISIYSVQGTLVRKVASDSVIFKINLDDLPTGVYFVEILNDYNKQYQKIFVR